MQLSFPAQILDGYKYTATKKILTQVFGTKVQVFYHDHKAWQLFLSRVTSASF